MASSDRAGSVGTEGGMSASITSSKAAAYKSVRRDAIVLWLLLLAGVVFFPVAGYHMGGWPTAAISCMAASLALLAHADQAERDRMYFEGRPCTRSRVTGILRVYTVLCAIVIPVLGFIGGGWLDATIYTVYAILIWCSLYRADTLRHMNATEPRVNPLSRENMAIATAEGSTPSEMNSELHVTTCGSGTLKWVLSLGMIKWGGATMLTKRMFWLFIVLIAILTGAVAYACQHLPVKQQLWPIGAVWYAVVILLWFYRDVDVGRLRGDRFY